MKAYYMHLIDCEPAQFDGDQIIFATIRGHNPVKLCSSLKQIKKEKALSKKWRKEHGFKDDYEIRHIEVSIEED